MSYKALCNYVLKSVSKNFKSCLPPVRGQVPAKAEKTIITTKSRTSADSLVVLKCISPLVAVLLTFTSSSCHRNEMSHLIEKRRQLIAEANYVGRSTRR